MHFIKQITSIKLFYDLTLQLRPGEAQVPSHLQFAFRIFFFLDLVGIDCYILNLKE